MTRNYETMESLEEHKILLEAMKETGVKRLVDWGTPYISFSKDRYSFITLFPSFVARIIYPISKKEMVAISELLSQSDLDWTLVRFMVPRDDPLTDNVKISFGDVRIELRISKENIGS